MWYVHWIPNSIERMEMKAMLGTDTFQIIILFFFSVLKFKSNCQISQVLEIDLPLVSKEATCSFLLMSTCGLLLVISENSLLFLANLTNSRSLQNVKTQIF